MECTSIPVFYLHVASITAFLLKVCISVSLLPNPRYNLKQLPHVVLKFENIENTSRCQAYLCFDMGLCNIIMFRIFNYSNHKVVYKTFKFVVFVVYVSFVMQAYHINRGGFKMDTHELLTNHCDRLYNQVILTPSTSSEILLPTLLPR